MAKPAVGKRALIDKANNAVVIVTSVAAFITVFSLVSTKTLISQAAYQNRVINAKQAAYNQLVADHNAIKTLQSSYDAFTGTTLNAIDGQTTGVGPQDGNNAKIILDALPSSYDFPALATTLEKLLSGPYLNNQVITINSITGTDDEVAQSTNQSSSTPTPVPMPFQLSVSGNYAAIQALISEFEHSIRPFQIQTMNITGSNDKLTANITAQTFYQPAKVFNTTKTKAVK